MVNDEKLKEVVREKYGQIALTTLDDNAGSCCGVGGCGTIDYNIMNEDYSQLDGYNPDADLGLGCGIPTEFAQIRAGQTVVDLGSGAGNDAFVARKLVGPSGFVIGVDMTPAMIDRARQNNEKLGYKNVEFRLGEIENMPVASNSVDVVVSNCVLNLVPNKLNAFAEVHRIMKPGARFSISDIVLDGKLPANIAKAAEMYAGCVSGAIQKHEYIDIVRKLGFTDIQLVKDREISLPDDILAPYLNKEEIAEFRKSGARVVSITVVAQKSTQVQTGCCSDGNVAKSKAGGCGCN
ncbi:MAG TPA: arsenite methyltransferase [bacterium]|nr:arsenite methyltransferase [bacterium]